MSLFRSRKSAAVQPDFSGLALQTSTAAAAIPIVYGTTRVAPNIIWSAGATAQPQYAQSGGGKGGGGGGSTVSGYEYYEWLMLAIGEGPIAGVSTLYLGHSTYPYGALGLSLVPGGTPQQPWAPAAAAYPAAALAYNGTAYMASSDFDLGASASVPTIGFEVAGLLEQLPSGDADPAAIVADLLTNPQYGAGFPAASLDAGSLAGTPGSYATYCGAAGLALSPALVEPETASAILARWLALTNTAAVWSGGRLKLIPYGDAALSGPQPRTLAVTIGPPLTVTPAPAALFAGDAGVAYAAGGALTLVAGAPGTGLSQGQYAVSGNSYAFSAADGGAGVVIRYLAQPAMGFVPNVAAVYDLTDDDFVAEDGRDPVEMSRSDPKAAPNVQRLECLDRANGYAATPIEARDQAAIEAAGLNPASTITAHEICDLGVALTAAQLILQRGLYARNSYGFRLSWECALLEPMDVVTLTDPGLGLARTPVRITAVAEDADGLLAVTAEECVAGIGTAAAYPAQAGAARPFNRAAVPAAVNPPVVFEPPPDLAGGTPQVWAAVSGGADGAADPNWGGATVWVSRDGASYSPLGEVTAPARQGSLTAPMGPGDAGLAVTLAASGGVLAAASAAEAAADATLAIVGTELVAYAAAQLTGANRYALFGLRRGLHGSSAAAHPAGTPFARLDAAIFKAALPQALVGVPLLLKFQSRNVFGGGAQDLATCVAYPYTPVGSGLLGPTAQLIGSGGSLDEGLASLAATQADDYGLASDPYVTPADEGLASA